jgi:hypothetical protein
MQAGNTITETSPIIEHTEEPENRNADMTQSLRDLANFLEDHDLPRLLGETLNIFTHDEAAFREAARGFGSARKLSIGKVLVLRKDFGRLNLDLNCPHESICQRIVTTRIAPATEEIVIPAQPERIVEDVSWMCPDSILAPAVEDHEPVKIPF